MKFKINDIIIRRKNVPLTGSFVDESIMRQSLRIINFDKTPLTKRKCYVVESVDTPNPEWWYGNETTKRLDVNITDNLYDIDIKTTRKIKLRRLNEKCQI